MADPLRHVHSEEQLSFESLGEKYREDNLQRVRRSLHPHVLVQRNKAGEIVRTIPTGLKTDNPFEHQRVDDWRKAGGVVPDFTDEFIIPDSKGLQKELRDLTRDAGAMAHYEQVTYAKGDSDGNAATTDEYTATEGKEKTLREACGAKAASEGDSDTTGGSAASPDASSGSEDATARK